MRLLPQKLIFFVLFGILLTALGFSQLNSFTYQGYLRDGLGNANGSYSLQFQLFDAVSGGNAVSNIVTKKIYITDAIFTVSLSFTGSPFNGSRRWLEISIYGNTLSPRQEVTATPYSLYAQSAPWSGITGAPTFLSSGSAAGGDLFGNYPNPVVGSNKIDSSKLVSDPASLSKVSGGALSMNGSTLNATGDVKLNGVGSGVIYPDGTKQTTAQSSLPSGAMITTASMTPPDGFTYTGLTSYAYDFSGNGPINYRSTISPNLGSGENVGTVALGSEIYIFGDTSFTSFNTSTKTWRLLAAPHFTWSNNYIQRTYFTMSVCNNKIYIFGAAEGLINNTVYTYECKTKEYDPNSNTWSNKASLQTSRIDFATAALNNRLYIMGGYQSTNPIYEINVYDPASNTWNTVNQLTFPLRAQPNKSTVTNNKFYITGYDNANYNNVKEYNPNSDTWNDKTPTGLDYTRTLFTINNKLWALGSKSDTVGNACHIYDDTSGQWLSNSWPADLEPSIGLHHINNILIVINWLAIYEVGNQKSLYIHSKN